MNAAEMKAKCEQIARAKAWRGDRDGERMQGAAECAGLIADAIAAIPVEPTEEPTDAMGGPNPANLSRESRRVLNESIEPDPRDAQIAVGKIMLLRTALHGLVSDRHGHDQGCACPWCFARAALSATEPKEPA